MLPLDFLLLATTCAPTVAPQTLSAIVHQESSFNPYAIGVVDGYLERQPKTLPEAIATVNALDQAGWNWSAGLAQINKHNFNKYGLTNETVFQPCMNLSASAKILEDCYLRALIADPDKALESSFSCYYSGNFKRGYIPDKAGDKSYVDKIISSANITPQSISYDSSITLPIPDDSSEIIVPEITSNTSNTSNTNNEQTAAPIRVISTKTPTTTVKAKITTTKNTGNLSPALLSASKKTKSSTQVF